MAQMSAQRGAEVVRQLLFFSRGQAGERAVVQPRHLIKDIVAIMRETFPREIEIQSRVSADLRMVMTEPAQLHQVLLNLAVNARDAMPHGGRLLVAAHNASLSIGDPGLPAGAVPGDYVVIEVIDSGQGISPEIQARIFDPFFTTKSVGAGTGLGLSTVLGIVRSHGGFVTVDSTPGLGSTFRVGLPAQADPAAAADESREESGGLSGSGHTILVVDDEASIRDATRLLLQRQNFRVITAINGSDAMRQFVEHRSEIRLVLTDLMMPVMNGIALIRSLRTLDPDLKIIVTSGVTEPAQEHELASLRVADVLPKPVPVPVLLAILHRYLAEAPTSPGDAPS